MVAGFGMAGVYAVAMLRGRPRGGEELPAAVVGYVAEQVAGGPGRACRISVVWRTIEYHRAQVRSAFGFREATREDEDKLAGRLAEEVCPVELREQQLGEALLVRCRSERIEPPGRIDRILGTARTAFEHRFCDRVTARLGAECAARLEPLVVGETALELLAELKSDPGKDWAGDVATRDRQTGRDPRAGPTSRLVRRRLGEVGGRLAAQSGPFLPAGSAGGGTAGAAEVAGGVALDAVL